MVTTWSQKKTTICVRSFACKPRHLCLKKKNGTRRPTDPTQAEFNPKTQCNDANGYRQENRKSGYEARQEKDGKHDRQIGKDRGGGGGGGLEEQPNTRLEETEEN